jgi:NAD(P)-dependent dehydrogenase (short-subunit alcohol dehydrogenase family)
MLRERINLTTGAPDGTGRQTARGLARRNATVIVVGRDPLRVAAAQKFVGAKAESGPVETAVADLAPMIKYALLPVRSFNASRASVF